MASHARSRYSINGRGSALWKTIAPYISSISMDCHWRIGNGRTKASWFGECIGLPIPKKLRNKSIKDVLENREARRLLLSNSNPFVYKSIPQTFRDEKDCLIWEGDPCGYVTTANFLKKYHDSRLILKDFALISQPCLPFKVSHFLWRVHHKALPTHDKIIKSGVTSVSKCVCCRSPTTESLEHLLIFSDHAQLLLDLLCHLFRNRRPLNIHQLFFDWGMDADLNSFSGSMGFGLSYAHRPADMLCFAKIIPMFTVSIEDLPDVVHAAILSDGNPHPCLFRDQAVFL